MSLPRKTFARRIITMRGYSDEQEIGEVMHADKVDREEAVRRLTEAKVQQMNRSVAQYVRHCKAKDRVDEARRQVLALAHHRGQFLCAEQLENIAFIARWKAPAGSFGYWDTGRVFREICRPLAKAGMLEELRDEDDRFVGYTITAAGRKELLGEP